ncbi:hypothetical protein KSC_100520 [Ktedonobacter sp. SOSP1-52]|nr:hypothetical protein KSC_100520 [Ktedonobacter sp. SOSP1-52]
MTLQSSNTQKKAYADKLTKAYLLLLNISYAFLTFLDINFYNNTSLTLDMQQDNS